MRILRTKSSRCISANQQNVRQVEKSSVSGSLLGFSTDLYCSKKYLAGWDFSSVASCFFDGKRRRCSSRLRGGVNREILPPPRAGLKMFRRLLAGWRKKIESSTSASGKGDSLSRSLYMTSSVCVPGPGGGDDSVAADARRRERAMAGGARRQQR